jgi:hypothetical protein
MQAYGQMVLSQPSDKTDKPAVYPYDIRRFAPLIRFELKRGTSVGVCKNAVLVMLKYAFLILQNKEGMKRVRFLDFGNDLTVCDDGLWQPSLSVMIRDIRFKIKNDWLCISMR